jgi:hypothetical protein
VCGVKVYPGVLNEFDTLAAVVSGRSIARYGDGEFKMCYGAGIKSQEAHPVLTKRLIGILRESGECLVGIPNIVQCLAENENQKKREFWWKQQKFSTLLVKREYASSFITRPDSAPWIDAPEYWSMLESLWKGQNITIVRGSGKSLTAERLLEWGARSVREIMAPRQHAWAEYDELLERIGRPDRVLLCLGPTATVMAVDLCAKGIHAIDLGHVGMFAKKHYAGEPMWVSEDEKAGAEVPAA